MAEAASISYGNAFSSEPRKSPLNKHIPESSKVRKTHHPWRGFESPSFWTVFYVGHSAFATDSQLERPQVLSPLERSRLPAYRFPLSRQRDRLESAPDPLAGSLAGGAVHPGRKSVAVDALAQIDHPQSQKSPLSGILHAWMREPYCLFTHSPF